jgi:hypothetical protein
MDPTLSPVLALAYSINTERVLPGLGPGLRALKLHFRHAQRRWAVCGMKRRNAELVRQLSTRHTVRVLST